MDFAVDLPVTPDNETNLLILVDCFIKWVELFPLQSKASVEVANVLYRYILPRFGKPRWIRVDAGKEWEGQCAELSDYVGV